MSEHEKAVVRRLFDEVWSQGDLSVLPDLLDPECVCRAAGEVPLLKGIDEYRQLVATYLALYGHVRVTVDQQIADDDTIASRWTARLPSVDSGQTDLLGMSFHKFRDGRIVEAWDTWDSLRATEAVLGPDPLSQLTLVTG